MFKKYKPSKWLSYLYFIFPLFLVTKINIANKQNYILELKDDKKTVQMGDTSNLSTKMLYIKSILEQNKKIEGEILVNTDLNNKGAIFRKKV